MAYTSEQIDRMFEKIPDDIQRALDSKETIDCLVEIQKKYNLPEEKVKELSAEIGMLLLGASSPQHFIPNVEKTMGIPREMAKAITVEVNEKIFRPVKESLKELHLLEKKKEEAKPSFGADILSLAPKKDGGTTGEVKKNTPSLLSEKITVKNPEVPKKEPEKEPAKAPDPYREAV